MKRDERSKMDTPIQPAWRVKQTVFFFPQRNLNMSLRYYHFLEKGQIWTF